MLLIGFRQLRYARLTLSFSIAVLWIFLTPSIAQILLGSLEGQFSEKSANVAMLLGGMLGTVNPKGGEPGLGEATNRALHTRDSIAPAAGSSPRQAIYHGSRRASPRSARSARFLRNGGCLRMPCSSRQRVETPSRMHAFRSRFGMRISLKERSARHLRFPHAARARRVPARVFQCRTVASRFWRQTTAQRRYSLFHARCFGTSDLVARGEGMEWPVGLPFPRVGLSTAQVVRDRLLTAM
jgi:hypothetical protein